MATAGPVRRPTPVSDEPDASIPGRAMATRRAIADVVRSAALGSYGVAGFSSHPAERIAALLVGRAPGIRVDVTADGLAVALDIRVAHGLPVAEVARQVDSAIRFGVRRAFGREIARLRIRVRGLDAHPGSEPPPPRPEPDGTASSLAESGMDLA